MIYRLVFAIYWCKLHYSVLRMTPFAPVWPAGILKIQLKE